jgi:AraC-like DNA-binding protein
MDRMDGPVLFRSYTPAPPLDRFIENFWFYQGYASPHLKERVLQDGTFKVVFNLQRDGFRIYEPWQAKHFKRYSGAIVSRPSAVPFVTDSFEEAHILGVNFKVGGALPFLGRIEGEAGGCHVNLADLWGRRGTELHDRLVQAHGSENRFRLLAGALLTRLGRGASHDPAVHVAVDTLGATGPASRTREVAKQVGLSQRRFISIFKEEIGITPKLFSRVRRFQRALVLIRQSTVPDWPALALACGYCDQSHMIRDFSAFSGFSPSAYVNRQRALVEQGVRVKHNHIPLVE